MKEQHSSSRRDTASCVVAAGPDAIYAAFSEPESLIKWLPPDGMTGRVLEYDFRDGGRYRIELTYGGDENSQAGTTTGKTDVSSGRFLTLDAGKRIVQSVEFESTDPSFAGEMLMTWSFERLPTGTRVTITAQNVPPGIRPEDHEAGLRSSLENLEKFVLGAHAAR